MDCTNGGSAWPAWSLFEAAAPELARFGRDRLDAGPAYLATVRGKQLPRVHPVSAPIGNGHLFLYMYPSSPKGNDLRHDGRFALHCGVADHDGSGGKFLLRGHARPVEDDVLQAEATAAGFPPREGYVLYPTRRHPVAVGQCRRLRGGGRRTG